METKFDVVIVGAGLAGLTAARELRKKAPQLKVVVLEAKDRVGGRTLTVNLKTATGTDQWDLGGQWVGLTQKHLLRLLSELHVDYYPQFTDGTKLAQIGGTKIRTYSGTLPSSSELRQYSVWEALDFVQSLTRLEAMAAKLNPADPFAVREAGRWDGMSVDEWARQNCYTRTMIDSLDLATKMVFGTQSKRLSLLYMLQYGRAAGSIADTLEAQGNGAQGYRIKGGAQQLSRMMADDLGDAVRLSTAVTKIEDVAGGLRISTFATDGSEATSFYRCQRVIMAVPPSEAGAVRYSPPLPFHKRQLFDSAPPGNLIKFLLTYKTAFWRQDGFSGEVLATGYTDTPGEMNALALCYDATTDQGSPALVGFVHNEQWTERSSDERRLAVLKDLERYFGPSVRAYIDYEDKDWHREAFNGGCPVACMPTGTGDHWTRIREPVDRIHFAGTESALSWPGYMSGAVESGERTAQEVLWNLHPSTVDRRALLGSVYAVDYRPPLTALTGLAYQKKSAVAKWTQRLMLVSVVVGVLYAVNKRYEVPLITRVTKPLEDALVGLHQRFFSHGN